MASSSLGEVAAGGKAFYCISSARRGTEYVREGDSKIRMFYNRPLCKIEHYYLLLQLHPCGVPCRAVQRDHQLRKLPLEHALLSWHWYARPHRHARINRLQFRVKVDVTASPAAPPAKHASLC